MENINKNYITFLRRLSKEYNFDEQNILIILRHTNLKLYTILNEILIEILFDLIHQEINNEKIEKIFYSSIEFRHRIFHGEKEKLKIIIAKLPQKLSSYGRIVDFAIFWTMTNGIEARYWSELNQIINMKFNNILNCCLSKK